MGTIIVSTLQMRKLRSQVRESVAHTDWYWNLVHYLLEDHAFQRCIFSNSL